MEFNEQIFKNKNLYFQTPQLFSSEIISNYSPQNDDIDITNDKTNDPLNSLILNQSKLINPSNFAKVSLPTKENEIINYLNITKLKSIPNLNNIEFENIQNEKKETKNNITTSNLDLINLNSLNLPKIHNIVSFIDTKCKLDLLDITKKAKNTRYNKKRFPALIMNIKNPKSTALIFESGKIVCLGTKNQYDCKFACKKFAKIIKKLNYPAQFTSFKIHNIVASCDVGFKIKLLNLKYDNFNCTNYEPEIFPGLTFRIYENKVVILIFNSGKIIFVGAKNIDDIYSSYKKILPLLYKYKQNN